MEDIPEEAERKVDMHQIRIKAWKLCRNYLTGVWKVIKAEDLILDIGSFLGLLIGASLSQITGVMDFFNSLKNILCILYML